MKNTDTNRRQFIVLGTASMASLLVACSKQSEKQAPTLDVGSSGTTQTETGPGTADAMGGSNANRDGAINANRADTGPSICPVRIDCSIPVCI